MQCALRQSSAIFDVTLNGRTNWIRHKDDNDRLSPVIQYGKQFKFRVHWRRHATLTHPHTHTRTQHKQNFANVHIKLAKLQIVFYFTQPAKECERQRNREKRKKRAGRYRGRESGDICVCVCAMPSFLRGLLADTLSCGRCLACSAVLSLPAASLRGTEKVANLIKNHRQNHRQSICVSELCWKSLKWQSLACCFNCSFGHNTREREKVSEYRSLLSFVIKLKQCMP